MLKHIFSSSDFFFNLLHDLFIPICLLSYHRSSVNTWPHLPKSQVPSKPSTPAQDKMLFPSVTSRLHPTRHPIIGDQGSCGFPAQGLALFQAFKNRASLPIPLVKTSPASSHQSWDQ